MKQGIYLQGVEQVIGQGKDAMTLVKHVIAQVNEPVAKNDGTLYVDDPVFRITYLQPGVLNILPAGTLVTFELDTKQKKRNDGSTYEKIVPVEIKPAKSSKSA
ncbi:MAG: hypothetical protein NC132_07090 [Corallococcus sp.]|nr:hypothetical protein [Corallococcus sp.]